MTVSYVPRILDVTAFYRRDAVLARHVGLL